MNKELYKKKEKHTWEGMLIFKIAEIRQHVQNKSVIVPHLCNLINGKLMFLS